MDGLVSKAEEILDTHQVRSFRTIPNKDLYPHQWLWDSCFIAIGLRHVDVERAKNEVRGVLRGQWSDGMVPHVQFSDMDIDYFPDPHRWKHPEDKTSGITQPPLPAIAAWKVYQVDQDKEFLRYVVDDIASFHEWLYSSRGGELLHILHPWESGMDNTPVYDEAISRIQVRDIEMSRLDTDMVETDHRPSREYYERCLSLIQRFAEEDYDWRKIRNKSAFAFQDILFNSVWCQANQCLAKILAVLGKDGSKYKEWAEKTRDGIQSDLCSNGRFYSKDLITGDLIEKKTNASLIPLFAGVLEDEQLQSQIDLVDELTLQYPVLTTDSANANFDPENYWRGPIWVNMNWFIVEGLQRYGCDEWADEIRGATLRLIRENGFSEYFHGRTGDPCGIQPFSWSAALTIDLAKRSEK